MPLPSLVTLALMLTAPGLPAAPLTFSPIDAGDLSAGRREYLSAAWGDFDEDGRPDVYVAAYDLGPGELFRNTPTGFVKIVQGEIATDTARRTGAAWGDWDGDGHLDLFVSTSSSTGDLLYRNLGNGTLGRVAWPPARTASTFGIAAIWVDHDTDGLLDLFVVNGSGVASQPNALFRNSGAGLFVPVNGGDVSSQSRNSQGAAFGDYDGDGDLDLVVAHIFARETLFRNGGDGTFARAISGDVGFPAGEQGGSSACWADFDNDRDLDLLVVTGLSRNLLFRNDGHGNLKQVNSGIVSESGGDSVAGIWADFDNDGWLDLLLPKRSGRHLLYQGTGDGQFLQVTTGGIPEASVGANGVAVADYDLDGDLDVLLTHWMGAGPVTLHRNETTGNQWLRIRLFGGDSNRNGIGAKVHLRATIEGRTFWQQRQIGGFDSAASTELVAHFGLGNATSAELVRIEWPSGRVQEIAAVPSRQTLVVEESGTPALFVVPAGGFFTNTVTVALRSSVAGAEIRYTLDGSDPTPSSLLYQAPIQITQTTTLKARLFLNGVPAGEVEAATFTADPGIRFTPPGTLFTNRIDVAVTSRLPGTEIRLTADGSDPALSSPVYREPVRLTAETTLKARAFLNGFPVTEVLSATYRRVYAFDDEGIPPAWREEHFGPGYATDTRAAADADPDADGTSNRQEYVAGTDPLDALSGFQVGVRAIPEIRFASVPGRTYRVLRFPHVNSSESTVVAEIVATATETVWIDTAAGVVVNPAFYVVQPVR